MIHKIFAYGTLKRGFSNSEYLKECEFLGVDLTLNRYFMAVDNGVPFVFYDHRESEFKGYIKGEVYVVSDPALELLDELEEHPECYLRKRVSLVRFHQAWLYFYPHFTLSHYKGALIKPVCGVIEFKG